MSWEAVAAIGQAVGSVAMLVTLIYLAYQIRQNSELLRLTQEQGRSETRQRIVEHTKGELMTIFENPEIVFAGNEDKPPGPEMSIRLNAFLQAAFRQREFEFFEFQAGRLDAETFEAHRKVILLQLGSKRGQRWWQTVGRFGFNERFVAEVDLYAKGRTDYGREYSEALQLWSNEDLTELSE